MTAPASALKTHRGSPKTAHDGKSAGRAPNAYSCQPVPSGAAKPLTPVVADEMSQRFGEDFSDVRLHQGADAQASAEKIEARAYTFGEHIVLGRAAAPSDTAEGKRLLAHELAHVVQQRRGGPPPALSSDAPHEAAAERAASAVMSGSSAVSVSGATGVGVARDQDPNKKKKPQWAKGLSPDQQRDMERKKDVLDEFKERAHDDEAELDEERTRNRSGASERARHRDRTKDVDLHHGFPKFIGGNKIQTYIKLTKELHYLYHEELYLLLEKELKASGKLPKEAGRASRKHYGSMVKSLSPQQQKELQAKILKHAKEFDDRYRSKEYPDKRQRLETAVRRGIKEADKENADKGKPAAKPPAKSSAAAPAKPAAAPPAAQQKGKPAAAKPAAKTTAPSTAKSPAKSPAAATKAPGQTAQAKAPAKGSTPPSTSASAKPNGTTAQKPAPPPAAPSAAKPEGAKAAPSATAPQTPTAPAKAAPPPAAAKVSAPAAAAKASAPPAAAKVAAPTAAAKAAPPPTGAKAPPQAPKVSAPTTAGTRVADKNVPSGPPPSAGAAKMQAAAGGLQLAGQGLNALGNYVQSKAADEAYQRMLPSIEALQSTTDEGVWVHFVYSAQDPHPDSAINPVPVFSHIETQIGSRDNKKMPAGLSAGGSSTKVNSMWRPPGLRSLKTDLNDLWRRLKVMQQWGERETKRTFVGRFLLERKGSSIDIAPIYEARAHLASASIALDQKRPGAAEESMKAADALLDQMMEKIEAYTGQKF